LPIDESAIIWVVKKTPFLVIVIVVLLLLAGGAYLLIKHTHNGASQSAQTANTQGQPLMSPQKKSLFDFFSMGGSQKCTFSDKINNSSGTVYVSSGKMRGDFQSVDNGTTKQTHMINDGSYVYIWTDGQSSGYKMSLKAVKSEAAQVSTAPGSNTSGQTQSQSVNMHQQADYSCGGWSADPSLFTLPQGITFTDYSSMMQGSGSSAGTGSSTTQQGTQTHGSAAMCAECNQAPAGQARNQCLSALHCQ
jgi:hypothetical protein